MTTPPGPMPVPSVCLVILDGWGLAPDGPGNAISQAARNTSLPASAPAATASSIRVRSWRTTAPAPRLRWPTSELPIWPSGNPTARPEAARVPWT